MEELHLAIDYLLEVKDTLNKESVLIADVSNRYDFDNEPSCNRINLNQESVKWLMGYKAIMTNVDMIDEYVVNGIQFLLKADELLSTLEKSLNQDGKE